ncbi:ABC transporter permease [Halosolutus gelatinilyticus]|uniref:ABC transporter permease n=1 Tax=Halosolutus gelatinilyticus TaxID=2931975 RepID=UPI001FF18B65|nr:ABC transporter permease [Halosolutus gelatinilyticus]
MSARDYANGIPVRLGAIAIVVGLASALVLQSDVDLGRLVTIGFVNRSLEMAAPIALAAIGGLYAEKSGVFNIGLEGFMIIGALTTAAAMYAVGGSSPAQRHVWIAILVAVVVGLVLTMLFAVLLIRYEADQIVAGLAVWFVALGFAPFVAILVWDDRNYSGLASVDTLTIPYLADLPGVGPILFDQSPLVLLTAVFAVVAWVVLYRTRYGYWIQAAGENPEALDTAGVDVIRVRYAAVLFSGAMAALGGAVLLAHLGTFNGGGDTLTDGRGWIAIVAYLFGNYNPIGAAAAALLFAALDQLNVQFQTAGIGVPGKLVNLLPYAAVIVVLTAWGRTKMPASVGDPYESEE